MEKPFSQILLEHKKEHALTNEEMGQLLGLSARMYKYYENGDYDGSDARIKKYKKKLSGNGEPETLDTLRAENESLKKEMATLEKLNKSYEKQIAMLEKGMADIEKDIKKLEKRI